MERKVIVEVKEGGGEDFEGTFDNFDLKNPTHVSDILVFVISLK